MIKRNIEKRLLEWKNQANHMPLIIRGARQVGKTYTVKAFARQYFENIVNINFEYQPEFKQCFETNDPNEIISKISLITGQDIIEDRTLLFLDEIQECPKALVSLRYFKEKKPGLHVIAAGSLLEFVLNQGFSIPVGRIQFLSMHPLTFSEYLEARGRKDLREYLSNISIESKIDDIVHKNLLKILK